MFPGKTQVALMFLVCLITGIGQGKAYSQVTLFSDNFEDTSVHWSKYEELVDPCYTTISGESINSTDLAYGGTKSLRIWANKNLRDSCNHVIAGYKLFDHPLSGRVVYSIIAQIPNNPDTGQTGPEFSIQSTRIIGSDSLTFTAGIQYVPNPYVGAKWNLWQGHSWFPLSTVYNRLLSKNCWYRFELYVNYSDTTYDSMRIISNTPSVDLLDTLINLHGYYINGDAKHFATATHITLEATNLWTPCGTARATQFRMYYDNVNLSSFDASLGICQSELGLPFTLYPNPANDFLIVILPKGQFNIEMFNSIGQPIANFNQLSGMQSLDLRSYPKGCYYLRFAIEGGAVLRSFIKG